MRRLSVSIVFACLTFLANTPPIVALEIPNYLTNTPIGSWVTMESSVQRGRKTEIMHMTRSLVGEEMLDGKRYLWVEIKTQIFKVDRKGKKKPKGDTAYIKMLSEASLLEGNGANIMGNFRNLAKKMYIKSGDNVMDMSGGGAMADSMMQGSGSSMDFQMTDLNETRKIDTPLGTVTAHKYKGVSDAKMKVIIKTITTHSDADMWLSDEVPFGMVEMHSVTSINGKSETSSSKIIAGGMAGARSEVDISKATENPLNALKSLKFGRK